MALFPKVPDLFSREGGKPGNSVLPGHFASPELASMRFHQMVFTELVEGKKLALKIEGDTYYASDMSISPVLREYITEKFSEKALQRMQRSAPGKSWEFFGIGVGGGLGKSPYFESETFVVCDIQIDRQWQRLKDMTSITADLGMECIPVLGRGDAASATQICLDGFTSFFGNFPAAGLVARPEVDLYNHQLERISYQLRTADFRPKEIKKLAEDFLGARPHIQFRYGEPPQVIGSLTFAEEDDKQILKFEGNTDAAAECLFRDVVRLFNEHPATKATAVKVQATLTEYIAGPTPLRERNAKWFANLLLMIASLIAGPDYEKWAADLKNWDKLEDLARGVNRTNVHSINRVRR